MSPPNLSNSTSLPPNTKSPNCRRADDLPCSPHIAATHGAHATSSADFASPALSSLELEGTSGSPHRALHSTSRRNLLKLARVDSNHRPRPYQGRALTN